MLCSLQLGLHILFCAQSTQLNCDYRINRSNERKSLSVVPTAYLGYTKLILIIKTDPFVLKFFGVLTLVLRLAVKKSPQPSFLISKKFCSAFGAALS